MSAIPSWCRVGQRVVCINHGDWDYSIMGYGPDRVPMPNEVLTIHEVLTGADYNGRTIGNVTLAGRALEQVLLAFSETGADWVYNAEYFRPLVSDSEQDGIEARLFREKGHKITQREPERAGA